MSLSEQGDIRSGVLITLSTAECTSLYDVPHGLTKIIGRFSKNDVAVAISSYMHSMTLIVTTNNVVGWVATAFIRPIVSKD